MPFSGALTLTDLNDFITPSQVCIKPVESTDTPTPALASTEIRIDAGEYYEVSKSGLEQAPAEVSRKKLEQAQITLNDCLACSGCITSAESVLITLQSHEEVLNFLHSNPDQSSPSHRVPVLSVAPQTLASLAASISADSDSPPVTLRQVLLRVRKFCKEVLGFAHVWDTTFARHIALLEHVREFAERKSAATEESIPMLASACPGWICYAEKTHKEMLPFIARTKSPQQVMGTLVKEWMAKRWGKTPDQVYHVSVMPCYDKKLEASRQDFYNELYSTRDVDCVITTGELDLIMRDKGYDLSNPVDGEDAWTCFRDPNIPDLIFHPGTSSGSYLHSIISFLTSTSDERLDLSVHAIRTSDYEEYILRKKAPLAEDGEGNIVFKGAKCYGFRNLQNVVRKVGKEAGVQVGRGAAGRLAGGRGKRGRKSAVEGKDKGYDYVEVMACPGGCVNGGGQLKPRIKKQDEEGYARDWEESGVKMETENGFQNAKWGDREWTKQVESAYWRHDLPTPPPSPKIQTGGNCPTGEHGVNGDDAVTDTTALTVLRDLCQPTDVKEDPIFGVVMDTAAEAKRRSLFRTQYRAVESEVIGLAVKW